jgi:hypothetical protein
MGIEEEDLGDDVKENSEAGISSMLPNPWRQDEDIDKSGIYENNKNNSGIPLYVITNVFAFLGINKTVGTQGIYFVT